MIAQPQGLYLPRFSGLVDFSFFFSVVLGSLQICFIIGRNLDNHWLLWQDMIEEQQCKAIQVGVFIASPQGIQMAVNPEKCQSKSILGLGLHPRMPKNTGFCTIHHWPTLSINWPTSFNVNSMQTSQTNQQKSIVWIRIRIYLPMV